MSSRTLLAICLLATGCIGDDPPDGGDPTDDTADTTPVDVDGDGYDNTEDCDDDDATQYPGAAEQCNGEDDDCDGTPDNGAPADEWFADTDSDGFGDALNSTMSCGQPTGYVADNTDCDDASAGVNPDASEDCNGVDDDCSGVADDALTAPLADNQNGVCEDTVKECDGTNGWIEPDYVTAAGAFDLEVTCDGLDNDCDGLVDNGLDAPDADMQDGECSGADKVCDGINGWIEPDYTLISTYETAEATCDGLDNDCNGFDDDVDDDSDGDRPEACGGGDCDDLDATVFTGAPEDGGAGTSAGDLVDNDCDTFVDEGMTYGGGRDGALNISSNTDWADIGGFCGRVESSGTDHVALRSDAFTGNLSDHVSVGDKLLVTYAQVNGNDMTGHGDFAFVDVANVSGRDIEFVEDNGIDMPNSGPYVDEVVLVYRLPQFTDVDITGGVLSTDPWDGSCGGFVGFVATGSTTFGAGGQIDVTGLGFRGPDGVVITADDGSGGRSGEGYAHGGIDFTDFRTGNGGGGTGGTGNCDVCNASGGGGGGAIQGGSGDAANMGSLVLGGQGGGPSADGINWDWFHFGGSGGSGGTGNQTGSYSGSGGDGGGMVVLFTREADFAVGGAIIAEGTQGSVPGGAGGAAGGGGAGGTVWLKAPLLDYASGGHIYSPGAEAHPNQSFELWGGDGAFGATRVDFDTINGNDYGSTGADSALTSFGNPLYVAHEP